MFLQTYFSKNTSYFKGLPPPPTLYNKGFFLIFLCLAFSVPAFAKKESFFKTLGLWNIKVSSKELALSTALSGRPLMALYGPSGDYTFMASSEQGPYVSLKLVRERMKTLKAKSSSLKVRKQKNIKIFSFVVQNQVHWLSTDGAYLVAEAHKALTKKQYLGLVKRVKRRL